MQITVVPTAGVPNLPETTIEVSGDVLIIDGTPFDLNSVPEGGEAVPSDGSPFVGAITRQNGQVHCTISCRYDASTAEPDQPADPGHWVLTATSGTVTLPIIRKDAEA